MKGKILELAASPLARRPEGIDMVIVIPPDGLTVKGAYWLNTVSDGLARAASLAGGRPLRTTHGREEWRLMNAGKRTT